ncbi:MAG: hypothetical protein D3905_00565, partial [Candidatus Electrothrix sp. AS4_5]|nr:hypothetical protein [Candidatus Electrothrix gigas]
FSILNLRMNGSGYSYFHELVKMSCKKRATAKKNTFLLFGNAPNHTRCQTDCQKASSQPDKDPAFRQ